MVNSHILQRVLDIHSTGLKQACYPSVPNWDGLDPLAKGHCFEYNGEPLIYYIIDDKPCFPELDYPVIKYLTPLNVISEDERILFFNELKEIGSKFHIVSESYNIEAQAFFDRFSLEETFYCHNKLFCSVGRMSINPKKYCGNIKIRNFIIDQDEQLFCDFYNKVFAFLLGAQINKQFVDLIVKRPSFSPEGYFIAEMNNQIVGLLTVEINPWGNDDDDFAYIYQIGVDDNFRRTGLANELLNKCRDFLIRKKVSRLGVSVRSANVAANVFFEQHGFKKVYGVKGYLLDIE